MVAAVITPLDTTYDLAPFLDPDSASPSSIKNAKPRSYYDVVLINGTPSPGIIPPNGIDGFEREIGWEKKEGKGAQGATLTRIQRPPAEGTITLQFWLPEHFFEWNAFVAILHGNPKAKGNDQALVIYHPVLAVNAITSVVVTKIHPTRHVGRGVHEARVEMIEWTPVPKKSIVNTPSASASKNSAAPGGTPDPIADQQQKIIQDLLKQAQGL